MDDLRWPRDDLVRRLLLALEVATDSLRILAPRTAAAEVADSPSSSAAPPEKIVAETAMLLMCAAQVGDVDDRIRDAASQLAQELVPLARSDDVIAAIWSDPANATNHAIGHLILSRLGFPDEGVDGLLRESVAIGRTMGPERLPHRWLELEWLSRVWDLGAGTKAERGLLSRSILGRPIDALAATRFDFYAFTHDVMYSTDFGVRRLPLRRSLRSIAADAEAGLALALALDDLDLTAELCLTWPLLATRWSPSAALAFRLLTDEQDAIGFVRGPSLDEQRLDELEGMERRTYLLATSYHANYVTGFLWAAALRAGPPPATVGWARHAAHVAAGAALWGIIENEPIGRRWKAAASSLSGRERGRIASLLLLMLLRRAREAGNVALLRHGLEIALEYEVGAEPSIHQAAGLLRRTVALNALTSRRSIGPMRGDVPGRDPWCEAESHLGVQEDLGRNLVATARGQE